MELDNWKIGADRLLRLMKCQPVNRLESTYVEDRAGEDCAGTDAVVVGGQVERGSNVSMSDASTFA